MIKMAPIVVCVATLTMAPGGMAAPPCESMQLAVADAAEQAKTAPAHAGTAMVWVAEVASGTILLAHEPIASVGLGKKTTRFKLEDSKLAAGLVAGDMIRFEFRRAGSDYVIHRIEKR